MMTWNKPSVEELNVKATADPKPSFCPGELVNGTCKQWCNGAKFGPCDFYPANKCKLKKNPHVQDS